MSVDQLKALHSEHRYWLSELNFIQDEIKFFQNKLATLAAYNKDNKKIQDNIKLYKDKYIELLTKVDNFRYEIMTHEKVLGEKLELANRLQENIGIEDEHHKAKEEIEEFIMEYKNWKHNFEEFLGKNF